MFDTFDFNYLLIIAGVCALVATICIGVPKIFHKIDVKSAIQDMEKLTFEDLEFKTFISKGTVLVKDIYPTTKKKIIESDGTEKYTLIIPTKAVKIDGYRAMPSRSKISKIDVSVDVYEEYLQKVEDASEIEVDVYVLFVKLKKTDKFKYINPYNFAFVTERYEKILNLEIGERPFDENDYTVFFDDILHFLTIE